MGSGKEWILALPAHKGLFKLDEIVDLVKTGKIRPTDVVKKLGGSWKAASEIPELADLFKVDAAKPAEPAAAPAEAPPAKVEEKTETSKRPSRFSRIKALKDSAEQRAVPEPAIDPMTPRDLSGADLLRLVGAAFAPRRLLVAAAMAVPVVIVALYISYFGALVHVAFLNTMFDLVHLLVLAVGGAGICIALAQVTRRQIEGAEFGVKSALVHGLSNVPTALVTAASLAPTLLALAVLLVMGVIRNTGEGVAAFLSFAFAVPMLFGLLAAAGMLLYQIGAMYVPSAAAVEGRRTGGAVRAALFMLRARTGDAVLHWLVVTVATGIVAAVTVGLVMFAIKLPDLVFPAPSGSEGYKTLAAWLRYRERPLFPLYAGLAFGLAAALPLSLFSTLSMLSYLLLRKSAGAPPVVVAPPPKPVEPAPEPKTSAPAASEKPPVDPDAATPVPSKPPVDDLDKTDIGPIVKKE